MAHNGNPVMTWMISNVTAAMDPAGNLKPDKSRSGEKIDGVTARLMALGLSLPQQSTRSVYEERGVLVLG